MDIIKLKQKRSQRVEIHVFTDRSQTLAKVMDILVLEVMITHADDVPARVAAFNEANKGEQYLKVDFGADSYSYFSREAE